MFVPTHKLTTENGDVVAVRFVVHRYGPKHGGSGLTAEDYDRRYNRPEQQDMRVEEAATWILKGAAEWPSTYRSLVPELWAHRHRPDRVVRVERIQGED